MRNYRKFTGPLVIALMMAGALGIAQPATADTGTLSGGRDICTFLNGMWLKFMSQDLTSAAAAMEKVGSLFECAEFVPPPPAP
jgi:L-alanine-DL-glutamate epimerase-like enolase superfamily enzyme